MRPSLFIANEFVSSKISDKHDDFDFDIIKFLFFLIVTFLAVLLMEY